jgi:hypothetical protein
MTSITDTGVGRITVTIGTDFSSANYTIVIAGEIDINSGTSWPAVKPGTRAAGSFEMNSTTEAEILTDPGAWHWACFGDQ